MRLALATDELIPTIVASRWVEYLAGAEPDEHDDDNDGTDPLSHSPHMLRAETLIGEAHVSPF